MKRPEPVNKGHQTDQARGGVDPEETTAYLRSVCGFFGLLFSWVAHRLATVEGFKSAEFSLSPFEQRPEPRTVRPARRQSRAVSQRDHVLTVNVRLDLNDAIDVHDC